MFFRDIQHISIRLKVIISLIITTGVLLSAFVAYKYISRKSEDYMQQLQKDELSSSIRSIMQLKSEDLHKLTIDYSCFDWMISFIQKPDLDDAKSNITPVTTYELGFVQIYNLNKQLVYADVDQKLNDTIDIPAEVFHELYHKLSVNYFVKTPFGPLQIVGSTVHPSADLSKRTKPNGYFFVAKLLDSAYMAKFQQLLNCQMKVRECGNGSFMKSPDSAAFSIHSFNKQVIYQIIAHKESTNIANVNYLNDMFEWLIIFIYLVILVTTLIVYNKFIIKPLGQITYTMNTDSPEKLIELGLQTDEFGKISRLIMEFFHQRDVLMKKLIEINKANEDMEELNEELLTQKHELQTTADSLLMANSKILEKTDQIEKHKIEIELQNKEITESITYAKVIQDAVLNVPEQFNNTFPEHFIFYQARNILSGDFYWIKEHLGKYYIAGADCTGHSLAGALLSMMGISFLNEIMYQSNDISAGEMLDKLRSYLVETLHQTGEFGEAHNGMDVVMCIIDTKKNTLEYAGANNPLYIVSENTETREMEIKTIKGESMPVGIYIRNENFSSHQIQIQPDDMIYISTDGYMDQFGGPLNKKYNSKNYKKLLLNISQQSMTDQLEHIGREFDDWKGEFPQTDDVLVFGIRYKPIFQI
jgi:serine phosphatase RsbU (regulator of sigma subunit)